MGIANKVVTFDELHEYAAHTLQVGDLVPTRFGADGRAQHLRQVLAVTQTRKGVEVQWGMPRNGAPTGAEVFKNADEVIFVAGRVEAIQPKVAKKATQVRGKAPAKAPKAPKATQAVQTPPKAAGTLADRLSAKLAAKLGPMIDAAIDQALDQAIDQALEAQLG